MLQWYNSISQVRSKSWVEIAYTCTLHKALENDPYLTDGYWAPSTYGKFVNQDRNFSIRLRVWKEGWSKAWTPQIVIGGNDVVGDSWVFHNLYPSTKRSPFFVLNPNQVSI